MNAEIKSHIEEFKIIAIERKVYGDQLVQLAESLYAGGIRILEITFDQADPDCLTKTADSLALLSTEMKGKMTIGAGTVLNVDQVEAAMAGGAKFIVSPNTDETVIRHTKQKGLLSIPGAMTPSEMVSAANYGADYVKVFPVSDLGLKYMRNVMAPLNHIKFIATGGVGLDNLSDILQMGFVAAGIGGYLADRTLIANSAFEELTNRAREFVKISKSSAR